MEQSPLFPIDKPAAYRICVMGGLESSWVDRYWGMTSSAVKHAGEPEQTIMVGEVADQAALHGLLAKLRDLGLPLMSVNSEAEDPRS